jgi:hypothetical protein
MSYLQGVAGCVAWLSHRPPTGSWAVGRWRCEAGGGRLLAWDQRKTAAWCRWPRPCGLMGCAAGSPATPALL